MSLVQQFDPKHGGTPKLMRGNTEGDSASATCPVFTTIMNNGEFKKKEKKRIYRPHCHPVSCPKGNTSTHNGVCVHD